MEKWPFMEFGYPGLLQGLFPVWNILLPAFCMTGSFSTFQLSSPLSPPQQGLLWPLYSPSPQA